MGTKKFDHITPVFKSFHWLRVEKRINCKMLLLVYHASLYDQAPEYMRDMLQEGTNVQTLHSTVSSLLPWLKGFGDHAFSIAATRLCTALSGSITHSKSIGALRKPLKTHFSEHYINVLLLFTLSA